MKKEYIPDIVLERYLLGEMDKNEKKTFENLLSKDPNLLKRVEQLQISTKEILNTYSSKSVAQAIHKKLQEKEQKFPLKKKGAKENTPGGLIAILDFLLLSRSAMVFTGFFLTVTIAITILSTFDVPKNSNQESEVVYLKGDEARLSLYRQRDNNIEELAHKSIAMENDRIQISYFIKKPSYAIIFSVDGNGVITPHVGAANPLRLEGGKTYTLDHSYQLDNAPRYETFFLAYSESVFKTETAIQQVLKTTELSKEGLPQKEYTGSDRSLKIVFMTLVKNRE